MKHTIKLLLAIALATLSLYASAIPIGDVGSRDSIKAQTSLSNSGFGTEKTWVESILGDVTYNKLSGSGGGAWQAVTGVGAKAGDYAMNFGSSPVYFLVKTGGGGGTGVANTHFLYKNNANVQWGFINLANFGAGVSLTNIGVISHVGTTGSGSVPAPGPLIVMAIGLTGIMGVGRFKKTC